MLYIYRREPSEGAVRLAAALREAGVPAKKVRFIRPRNVHDDNPIICWGDVFLGIPEQEFPATLNNRGAAPIPNKLDEIYALQRAAVPTVAAIIGRPEQGYLGRSFFHHGGSDLLNPPARPNYWVRKEEIAREYRLHIFKGQSIRAGRKVAEEGAHPWIRSLAAGWTIHYDGHGVRAKHRDVAKAAVAALGLDFGAVDVAERPDGSVFVLEVNRAPGLEGQTVVAYQQAVMRWLNG